MRFTLRKLIAVITIAAIIAFCSRSFFIRPVGMMNFDGTALLVSDQHEMATKQFEIWLTENGYQRSSFSPRQFEGSRNIDFKNDDDPQLLKSATLMIVNDHGELNRKRYMIRFSLQSESASSSRRKEIKAQFHEQLAKYREWLFNVARTQESWKFLP